MTTQWSGGKCCKYCQPSGELKVSLKSLGNWPQFHPLIINSMKAWILPCSVVHGSIQVSGAMLAKGDYSGNTCKLRNGWWRKVYAFLWKETFCLTLNTRKKFRVFFLVFFAFFLRHWMYKLMLFIWQEASFWPLSYKIMFNSNPRKDTLKDFIALNINLGKWARLASWACGLYSCTGPQV